MDFEAMDFNEWMKMVNFAMEAEFGFDSEHLPDMCYFDYFEDEMNPQDVVEEMYEML